ncbi:TIGR02391 family protein [Candidatus Poriferisodalis sp.]|uniref:TIGR02391 family protein n=1 Tax=Candidatus Poriferisodalis sp. TaxID=3101277 RepID=UPI003D13AA3B
MLPVKYRNDPALRSRRQDDLNEVLVHTGLSVKDDGQVAHLRDGAATTLDEAARRAGSLRTELRRRGTHPDVLRYCTDELLRRANFHAEHEAAKSIPDRLRVLTGRVDDGADLINATLTPSSGPAVAINAGRTPSDRSEQSGLANFAIGLLGLYRNPLAHDPRLRRKISDDELLEALTAISMVQRRLDDATIARVS